MAGTNRLVWAPRPGWAEGTSVTPRETRQFEYGAVDARSHSFADSVSRSARLSRVRRYTDGPIGFAGPPAKGFCAMAVGLMPCRTICTKLIDSLARHIVFISNHLPNDSGEKSMLPHRPAGFWLPMTFAGAAVLVLSAYVSLYRDIQLDIVLVVVLFSCGSYAFWQTRDRGWRSVCTVGGVVATLLLLDVILFFPHLPDQVFRARVVKGIAAGFHLYRPLAVACVFFTMLSMLVASVAHHALKRRLIASSVSVVGVGLLITGMIAYVRANPPVRSFAAATVRSVD